MIDKENSTLISLAKEQDLQEILLLQKEAYRQEAEIYDDYQIPTLTQTIESIQEEWQQGLILKATVKNEIIGSVRGYVNHKTCFIGRVVVKPGFQNKGIGKLLMKAIENSFNKVEQFELFTGYRSEKNLFIYKKLGYSEFKSEQINEKLNLIFLRKTNNKTG